MQEASGSATVKLHPEWLAVLGDEFAKPYMRKLKSFLLAERQSGKVIFPPGPEMFDALNLTPLSQVKVVILGQDPYHGDGQAHGLSFSVKPGVPIPPSLVNIYKEMKTDLGIVQPKHGFLDHWSRQGVLLLNAVLTVERSQAASHRKRGWEEFTDRIIGLLNAEREHLVFMLWGSFAQHKGGRIDRKRHFVLESVHPSPLSAHRGFFGNHHFSLANAYLEKHGITPIDWQLPPLP